VGLLNSFLIEVDDHGVNDDIIEAYSSPDFALTITRFNVQAVRTANFLFVMFVFHSIPNSAKATSEAKCKLQKAESFSVWNFGMA
jgi:hypothetical protein